MKTPRAWLALAVVLAALLSGCGDQACVEWAESDGACPSQNDATTFMVQSCGQITSVDSEGTFSDNLCCYDVTRSSGNSPCLGRGIE